MTRLGNFLKLSVAMFLVKVSQIFMSFGAILKKVKIAVATFWRHFETFGLPFISTSGHTVYKLVIIP